MPFLISVLALPGVQPKMELKDISLFLAGDTLNGNEALWRIYVTRSGKNGLTSCRTDYIE
jgi:hypothetical protein